MEKSRSELNTGFRGVLSKYERTLKEHKAATGEAIYQTIFLDKERSSLWSIDKLRPSKVLDRAWWSAFSPASSSLPRAPGSPCAFGSAVHDTLDACGSGPGCCARAASFCHPFSKNMDPLLPKVTGDRASI